MKEQLIEQASLLQFHPITSFTVISGGRVVNIIMSEITHVSKYGNETIIYTGAGKYKTYRSIQEIVNDLPMNDFFRIHKSHVIALKWMTTAKKGMVKVGGFHLPISKYYKMQLLESLKHILHNGYKTIVVQS